MKKTLLLIADPEITRTISRNGMPVFAGYASYGNEPSILKVGKPAIRGDPNAPPIVLKEGLRIICQSAASLAVNRNSAVSPFVQAITSAKPNAAVPCR